MRFDAGTTDVPTAGTRVRIKNTIDKVKAISVKGRAGNTGNVYFGVSDVAAADGWELAPGRDISVDFGDGSVLANVFYVDAATNGDDVDWAVVMT